MLVLSRQKNERIVIGGCITIVVVDIRGDKARLGIEAPAEMYIHREEVQRAIEREEGAQPSFLELLLDERATMQAEIRALKEQLAAA